MPTEQELEAQRCLRTFYGYIFSWHLCCPVIGQLLENQKRLVGFQKLQESSSEASIKGSFLRGCLTLRAMQQLPLDVHPELATCANFWVPVQAYYAIHGFGLAALSALGTEHPRDHRKFRAAMSSSILPRLMPYPFNVLCSGNPSDSSGTVTFEGLSCTISDITDVSNLSKPNEQNAPLLAGKSVYTTRKWMLEELFEKLRLKNRYKNRSRRNLNRNQKEKISIALHGTSLIDLLYRMRVRSNYDDPKMFIYGQTDGDTARNHYGNLLRLVEMFSALCGNIISKKIGRLSFQRLAKIVSPCNSGDTILVTG